MPQFLNAKVRSVRMPDNGPLFELTDVVLVREGDPRAKEWRRQADAWHVTICAAKQLLSGRDASVDFDYFTGIGHRRKGIGCDAMPAAPDITGPLGSMASDWSGAQELPAGDDAAADYVRDNFSTEAPSECLRVVRDLRDMAGKVETLCAAVGVKPETFAAWAMEF